VHSSEPQHTLDHSWAPWATPCPLGCAPCWAPCVSMDCLVHTPLNHSTPSLDHSRAPCAPWATPCPLGCAPCWGPCVSLDCLVHGSLGGTFVVHSLDALAWLCCHLGRDGLLGTHVLLWHTLGAASVNPRHPQNHSGETRVHLAQPKQTKQNKTVPLKSLLFLFFSFFLGACDVSDPGRPWETLGDLGRPWETLGDLGKGKNL
jgi:hypothetical protein